MQIDNRINAMLINFDKIKQFNNIQHVGLFPQYLEHVSNYVTELWHFSLHFPEQYNAAIFKPKIARWEGKPN